MSTHIPEGRSSSEQSTPERPDPWANFRFATAVGALPVALVMNFIPLAGFTWEVLTEHDSKTSEQWILFWTFWLAFPFFLTAVVAAIAQIWRRGPQNSRVLHRWRLGGLAIGILILCIGVRL